MKKLSFTENIKASPEKVWKSLWEDKNYREWTSAFGAGSHAVSDWKEGSRIQFLGAPGGDGIYATIATKKDNEQMSFRHIGEMKEGKEMGPGAWEGAMEEYFLTKTADGTQLDVRLDTTEEFADYMSKTFPTALAKVREIAERK